MNFLKRFLLAFSLKISFSYLFHSFTYLFSLGEICQQVLVTARCQVQYDKYLSSFSYFAKLWVTEELTAKYEIKGNICYDIPGCRLITGFQCDSTETNLTGLFSSIVLSHYFYFMFQHKVVALLLLYCILDTLSLSKNTSYLHHYVFQTQELNIPNNCFSMLKNK